MRPIANANAAVRTGVGSTGSAGSSADFTTDAPPETNEGSTCNSSSLVLNTDCCSRARHAVPTAQPPPRSARPRKPGDLAVDPIDFFAGLGHLVLELGAGFLEACDGLRLPSVDVRVYVGVGQDLGGPWVSASHVDGDSICASAE